MIKKIIDLIKLIFTSKRVVFEEIAKFQNLHLHYPLNKDGYDVFMEVFSDRYYSEYFPFYRDVTILDLGAHYGYFSIFASKNAGANSSIYCFEPHPHNLKILQKNLDTDPNITNVTVIPKAISDHTGEVFLQESKSFNHHVVAKKNGKNEEEIITVPSIKLEDWMNENGINKIDFLKVDVEGSEYAFFEDILSSTLSKIHTIVLEFHDEKHQNKNALDLISKLEDNQFEIKTLEYQASRRGTNYGKIVAMNLNWK